MARQQSSLFLFLFLIIFAAPASSQAPVDSFKLKSSPTLAIIEMGSWRVIQKGTEFRKVTLKRVQPHYLIDLKMVRFDTRWVVPRIIRSVQYNLKRANVKTLAEKSGAIATINANYFDEKGKPLGFLKAAAEEVTRRVSRSSLFTGIFGVKDSLPFIIHRDHFSARNADEGLQAGPLLLTKGTALHVKRGASKRSRRSLIGIDTEKRLIIAVTEGLLGRLSWVEVQEFFAAEQWQVQAMDLLNLDGGGSAQLYVRGLEIEEYVRGTSDVPVAVGFFQKSP